MLGDGALGETEVLHQIDHAVLPELQMLQDHQSGRIAEAMEEGCRRGQRLGFGNRRQLMRTFGLHRHITMLSPNRQSL